jgi:hypothetical protein
MKNHPKVSCTNAWAAENASLGHLGRDDGEEHDRDHDRGRREEDRRVDGLAQRAASVSVATASPGFGRDEAGSAVGVDGQAASPRRHSVARRSTPGSAATSSAICTGVERARP